MALKVHPAVAGSTIPVFTSSRGEAAVTCAYEAVMDAWPIDYEELDVSTSFGDTHVIAGGPHDGPPVVLLHALFATATSWYRSVEGLSHQYRTYCVDVIGEANKSIPTRPIKSMDDFLQWFDELLDGLGIDTLFLVGNSYLPGEARSRGLVTPAPSWLPSSPKLSTRVDRFGDSPTRGNQRTIGPTGALRHADTMAGHHQIGGFDGPK